MATKKPTKPTKFRQARRQGKIDAKKAFSGKLKAVKKDPKSLLSKEDTEALKEMDAVRKAQKKGQTTYQTTERGEKVFTKPSEVQKYEEARAAEERRALEKFREETYGTKTKEPVKETKPSTAKKAAPVKKSAPAVKKSATAPKKFVAKTEAAKSPAKAGMTRAEKSAANKAAWAKMTPAERKNWAANKPKGGSAGTVQNPKLPSKGEVLIQGKKYDVASGAADKKMEKLRKQQTPKSVSSVRTNVPKVNPNYAVAVRPKAGEVVAKTAIKAAKKSALRTAAGFAGKMVGGRVGAALAIGSVLASPLLKEMKKSGDKVGKSLTADSETSKRVKKPKGKYSKTPKKSFVQTSASGKKSLSPSHMSSTAGMKIKTGAGGSTTQYVVKKGDTLSGIAAANKTTLAALRAANPTIMKNAKYKQGANIWAGTKVNLKKK